MYPWYVPLWARVLFFTGVLRKYMFLSLRHSFLYITYIPTAAVPVSFLLPLPEVLQKKTGAEGRKNIPGSGTNWRIEAY